LKYDVSFVIGQGPFPISLLNNSFHQRTLLPSSGNTVGGTHSSAVSHVEVGERRKFFRPSEAITHVRFPRVRITIFGASKSQGKERQIP